jgi:hypothetical protein
MKSSTRSTALILTIFAAAGAVLLFRSQNPQMEDVIPSAHSETLSEQLGEGITNSPISDLEIITISPGVFLERAKLSDDRIREIQTLAKPGHKDVSEIPEFELAPKEIRTVEEAFDRIKFISMVEYPRFYFFDGDNWYFSGGRRVIRADDFSDGYRVSKTGFITMWYERK